MDEDVVEPELSPAERVHNAFNPPEEAPEVIESPVAETVQVESTSPGHPAWQSILDVIPEALRPSVIPELQKWDQGVNDKLASVHSQYDPYKSFLENQVSAEQLETANRLYQALDADPLAFYKQLQEHYKFEEQGQQVEPELDLGEYAPDDLAQHPLFKQQQEQLAQMQAQWEAVEAERSQKEADIWLETRQLQISEKLKEANIEADWDYILPRAAAEAQRTGDYDTAIDNATKSFEAMIIKYRTPVANTTAPPVISPTGALPSTAVDINALSGEDRRKYIAQSLANAFKS